MAGFRASSKRKTTNNPAIELRLQRLQKSLERHNFTWAAKAIGDYLTGKCSSLDQAFGLIGRRGTPRTADPERDAIALRKLNSGESLASIERETRITRTDLKRLRAAQERWLGTSTGTPAQSSADKYAEQFDRRVRLAYSILLSDKQGAI